MGSIVGAILAAIIIKAFALPQSTLFLLAILITIVSVKEINIYEKETGEHDGKEIVIDEVAGVFLAISIMGGTTYLHIFLAFLFFRLFDIWKPSYIGWIDKNVEGGMGVMGDDLLAGIVAGIVTSVISSILIMGSMWCAT